MDIIEESLHVVQGFVFSFQANEFACWQQKHVKTCFNTFSLSAIEYIRWAATIDYTFLRLTSLSKMLRASE